MSKVYRERIAFERGYRVSAKGILVNSKKEPVLVSLTGSGYYSFGIGMGGSGNSLDIAVHRLVAYQKYGDIIYSHQVVRHLDGNKINNIPSNIALGSYSDNQYDIPKNKRLERARKSACTKRKFTKKEIEEIINLRSKGEYYKVIAEKFGTTKSWIWNIVNKGKYSDLLIKKS